MNICAIGGGASARNGAARIRRLDKQARIDLFSGALRASPWHHFVPLIRFANGGT
jgi:hypothetical protein